LGRSALGRRGRPTGCVTLASLRVGLLLGLGLFGGIVLLVSCCCFLFAFAILFGGRSLFGVRWRR
jgi:hypothetical protein